MKRRTYQVKEVARIAGVSTRTLRYYDALGLLVPSAHTGTGYRLYDDSDLLRLQQIMIGRALGLALEDIRKLLDDRNLDRKQLLREQRAALVTRAQATAAMIQSVDAALALLDTDEKQETAMDMNGIFNGFNPHEDEARERWGGTASYEESVRRSRNYGANEWREVRGEWDGIMKDAAAMLQAHARPDAPESMDIAERYRLWLTRWFFVCSATRHRAMADMFEVDMRFARVVDHYSAGLAHYWSAAIRANATRCLAGQLPAD